MANPPYSIKRWSQAKFVNDPFGRNIWGTPPQGCADYGFQQHIIKSLKPDTVVVVLRFGLTVFCLETQRREMRKKND